MKAPAPAPTASTRIAPTGSSSGNTATAGQIGVINQTLGMQSSTQSQAGPGMNPQYGALPGTWGTLNGQIGLTPYATQSQSGITNGPYGKYMLNTPGYYSVNGSLNSNWSGAQGNWQPGYGSWSSGYVSPGSGNGLANSGNSNAGSGNYPGNLNQNYGYAPMSNQPNYTNGQGFYNGQQNFLQPGSGQQRSTSPYNTGRLGPSGSTTYGFNPGQPASAYVNGFGTYNTGNGFSGAANRTSGTNGTPGYGYGYR